MEHTPLSALTTKGRRTGACVPALRRSHGSSLVEYCALVGIVSAGVLGSVLSFASPALRPFDAMTQAFASVASTVASVEGEASAGGGGTAPDGGSGAGAVVPGPVDGGGEFGGQDGAPIPTGQGDGAGGGQGNGNGQGGGQGNGNGPGDNRSGLGDGTNPGQGGGRDNSPNSGTNNPGQGKGKR
jgi:hypothetical protein